MKFPVPILDDRTYDDVVRDAKALIREKFPEWTDFNASDPGITLIELFAWMTEMIIYRLNRVPGKNLMAFLNFIGLQRKPAAPAQALLTFTPNKDNDGAGLMIIPKGTMVDGGVTKGGQPIRFTTEKGVNVCGVELEKVYTRSGHWCDDATENALHQPTKTFDIFSGHSYMQRALYIGDDELLGHEFIGGTVTLQVEVADELDRKWELYWEYWDGQLWHGLELSGEGTGDEEEPKKTHEGTQEEQREYESEGPLPEGAFVPDETNQLSKSGTITFVDLPRSETKSVYSTKSHWLRARMVPFPPEAKVPFPADSHGLPTIRSIRAKSILDVQKENMRADAAFYQTDNVEQPIETTKDFFPFGSQPKHLDTFFFNFEEAFSTAGAVVVIHVDLEFKGDPDRGRLKDLVMQWEFYDGEKWQELGQSRYDQGDSPAAKGTYSFVDKTNALSKSGEICFNVPLNIQKAEVAGEERFWIRVRIAEGGYWKERDPADAAAPVIHSFVLQYRYHDERPLGKPRPPQYVVAYKDFSFCDFTNDNARKVDFAPFSGLNLSPTLYLGFKGAFPQGRNFGIHFSLLEDLARWSAGVAVPTIIWQYWNGQIWEELKQFHDGTEGFLHSGFFDFVAPHDHQPVETLLEVADCIADLEARQTFFESQIENAETRLEKKKAEDELNKAEADLARLGSLAESANLHWYRALLSHGSYTQSPKVQLIRLNTTTSINLASVNEELLGSSDGSLYQTYSLAHTPVLGEPEIWIEEPVQNQGTETIGLEGGSHEPGESDTSATERVRWVHVEDFFASGRGDRHFTFDEDKGIVQFGDDQKGMIPPPGVDNIIATYNWHAGKEGNLFADEIKVLISDIPNVDVTNMEPSDGGTESESVDAARARGIQSLRNRNRAVSLADYEWLAREASSSVGAAKAFASPNRPGEITVRVVPRPPVDSRGNLDLRKELKPTNALLEIIRDYLDQRRLVTTTINVIEPRYVTIVIELTVALHPYPRESLVLEKIEASLLRFLHPTEGGPDNAGWAFGRALKFSGLYSRVEEVNGVNYVKRVEFTDAHGQPIPTDQDGLSLEHDQLFFLKDVVIDVYRKLGK